jgi:hypothetical protein
VGARNWPAASSGWSAGSAGLSAGLSSAVIQPPFSKSVGLSTATTTTPSPSFLPVSHTVAKIPDDQDLDLEVKRLEMKGIEKKGRSRVLPSLFNSESEDPTARLDDQLVNAEKQREEDKRINEDDEKRKRVRTTTGELEDIVQDVVADNYEIGNQHVQTESREKSVVTAGREGKGTAEMAEREVNTELTGSDLAERFELAAHNKKLVEAYSQLMQHNTQLQVMVMMMMMVMVRRMMVMMVMVMVMRMMMMMVMMMMVMMMNE